MVQNNVLKDKIETGELLIGTWSVVPSVEVVEILARSGLDFIIIDMEHGPISFESAQKMVIAAENCKTSPLVRVSGVNQAEILRAFDIGAHGIHVPNVSSVMEVEKIIEYAKYPPRGKRGLSPFTRAGNYGLDTPFEYTKKANEELKIIIHIEGEDAMSVLDDALEYDEIDVIFVGLYDISKSLGIPGDVTNDRVLALARKITEKATLKGKTVGTIVTKYESIKDFVEMGMKYFTYSVDCEVVGRHYKGVVDKLKVDFNGKGY